MAHALQLRRSPSEDPTGELDAGTTVGKRTAVPPSGAGHGPRRRGDGDGDAPPTYALVRDGMLASDAARLYLVHLEQWQADYTDALRYRASDRATARWFERVAAYLAQRPDVAITTGPDDERLALGDRVAALQQTAANLEHLRDNVDATLAGVMREDRQARVFALIRARCRAFLDEVVAQNAVCPGGRIAGLLVANREGRPYDRSVFPKELAGLDLSGAPSGKTYPWDEAATYALEDVLEGLVAGVEVAFADYVRFNMQSRLDGAEAEYRFEQVATQVLIGRALAEHSGAGAVLAFAAFQWCFTNDLFFYVLGKEMANSVPASWDRGGIPDGNITWASWSLLGVAKDQGHEDRPMSGRDARLQGWVIAPALAYALAFLVQKLGGQALFGRLLSVSIDNLPGETLDDPAVVALRAKLGLTDDAALVAAVAPLITNGTWEGRRFTCDLTLGTETAGMLLGADVTTQQVARDSDGARGHLTVGFLDAGLHCTLGGESYQIAFGTKVHLPFMRSLVDDHHEPLDPTSFAIGPSTAGYWSAEAHLLAGGFDADLSVRGSPTGTSLELGAGVTYRAGRLTIGGRLYRVKDVTRDDAGIRFTLGVTL